MGVIRCCCENCQGVVIWPTYEVWHEAHTDDDGDGIQGSKDRHPSNIERRS